MTDAAPALRGRPIRRLPAWLALIAIGLPGVLALLPVLPAVAGVPVVLLLVNPTMLLVVFAGLGVLAAPRCGFVSLVALRVSGEPVSLFPRQWPMLLAAGIAAGIVVSLLDHATRGLWQPFVSAPPSLLEAWSGAALLLGVFYGGVVEEVTMRWGVMSLVVLTLWSILARRDEAPPRSAVVGGIVIAALVFAAGHLPGIVAGGVPLEAPLVIRTIFWNALLGTGFGALYAARNLESAMLAHAGFHLGVAGAALLT